MSYQHLEFESFGFGKDANHSDSDEEDNHDLNHRNSNHEYDDEDDNDNNGNDDSNHDYTDIYHHRVYSIGLNGTSEDTKPFLNKRDGITHRNGSKVRSNEKKRPRSLKYYGTTESQQYEQDENEVWRHHQLQR